MSPFWILLQLRMMEVVVTIGAVKKCKPPAKSSPPTNQHSVFYRPDALSVIQPTVSKHCIHLLVHKFAALFHALELGSFSNDARKTIHNRKIFLCESSHFVSSVLGPAVRTPNPAVYTEVIQMGGLRWYRTWWTWSTATWSRWEAGRSCHRTRWNSCWAASIEYSSFTGCFCRASRTSSSERWWRLDPPTTSSGYLHTSVLPLITA